MDKSSYFIENRALFGSFPDQSSVTELEKEGVRVFVNLTYDHEKKISPYQTNYQKISFPIPDREVPENILEFSSFIVKLTQIIKSELRTGERMYIHCKGGHGRSGVVVACILAYMFNLSPKDAIATTTECHSRRKTMRDKWRVIGSPQTYLQKKFVQDLFKTITFSRSGKSVYKHAFSNFSPYPLQVNSMGCFPTVQAALEAYKNPLDKEYIQKQIDAETPYISKKLGRQVILRNDWVEVRDDIFYYLVKLKFEQHQETKDILLSTGLGKIMQISKSLTSDYDMVVLGNILTRIRNEYYAAYKII
jgi:predicted NAD-dependent protein-ADP-ribosyltransferase YbiA (DUF1768 family)/protein-tyrosine phosphatase